MTILYKVQSNGHVKDSARLQNCVVCRISSRNIVAFCVLHSTHSCNVSVCDILTPWQSFEVCASKSLVNVLEWNQTGELLLLGYKSGNVEIWSTRNHALNTWILLHRASFPSEDIISAKFFHNGKSVYFNTQKKDLPAYSDKFERMDHRPTLAHYGAASVDGCFVVTASGLLGSFVIPKFLNTGENVPPTTELNTSTHCIGLSRCFITHCSVSYCPSGCFNVAVNSWDEPLINCFKVSVELEHEETVVLKCNSVASVFLPHISENRRISNIRSTTVNCEEVIFVVYDCLEGGLIEQWTLTKKHQAIHKLLQKNKSDFMQWEQWENTAKLSLNQRVTDMCLSKLATETMYIFVVLSDNSVQVLEPGLKKIGLTPFERLTDDQRLGCKLMSSDVTFMNQLLVVFDNLGQMYAMQVPTNHYEKNFKISTYALPVALLEYSIITGIDASDVLMLNLHQLEVLTEKLTENFTRQPAYTRHFYYSNFLSLKSNICRVQSRQQDFDNLITLHSISITFKSLLRPSDLSSQDKGPAENLAIILSEPLADVDKVLFNLDAKDFTVEPTTLQSLQQLIQWVVDLALSILNKLPEEIMKAKFNKKHGYDISRDIIAIGSIRELLVMIRIWGLLNPQCLPIYTKSVENFDVLSVLFRLLTRLAQNPSEPDEGLLDECSLLSTQVLIPTRQANTPTTLLNNHTSTKMFPFVFQTAVEPLTLQDTHIEEVVFTTSTRDDVSNLYLGSRAKSLRRCIRCGFINNVNKVAKTSALKAWCQRWQYCHCGGYWTTV